MKKKLVDWKLTGNWKFVKAIHAIVLRAEPYSAPLNGLKQEAGLLCLKFFPYWLVNKLPPYIFSIEELKICCVRVIGWQKFTSWIGTLYSMKLNPYMQQKLLKRFSEAAIYSNFAKINLQQSLLSNEKFENN